MVVFFQWCGGRHRTLALHVPVDFANNVVANNVVAAAAASVAAAFAPEVRAGVIFQIDSFQSSPHRVVL